MCYPAPYLCMMHLALTTTADGSFHLDVFSRWKYFHLPLLDFPKRPEGSWRSCRWGDESQGELIAKIWELKWQSRRIFSQRWWSQMFFLLGHNWCNEFFSPYNLFGIFSGDISWGCFGRGGNPAPKGFPQEPNAGGSSETSEVSQLEMFPLSPPSCDVFFLLLGVGRHLF